MGVLFGFLVALAIGLTGVGGGVLLVPILILYLGVPSPIAVGTALAFSAVVKLPATWVYLRQKLIDLRVYRWMVAGGLPGVVLGSLLLQGLESRGLRSGVLVAVGVTIALTAAVNLVRLLRGNHDRAEARDRRRLVPWVTFPIGLEVGFSSAGAGALGTLALLYLTELSAASVVGTDLLFGLTLSTVGGALHLSFGAWNAQLLGQLLLGGLPGAFLGARLATVIPARPLRAVLLLWLVYLGSLLFSRGLVGLAG